MNITIYTGNNCPACRPYVAQAIRMCSTINIVSVDNMTSEEVAQLDIMGLPTTVVTENGEEIARWAGNSIKKLELYVYE